MVGFLRRTAFRLQDSITHMMYGTETVTSKASFYECFDKLIGGKVVPMSTYASNVLIVVNVASQWGLTNQNYTELIKLHDEYGKQGFKVLAFPCNQFGKQEPSSHEEILEFVKKFDENITSKIEFFEKGCVNGAETREPFSFLKNKLKEEGNASTDIRWNFTKFLIDNEGQPFKRYGPKISPMEMESDIKKLLDQKEKE